MTETQQWPNCAFGYLVSFSSGDGITSKSIEEVGKYPVWGANGLRGFTSTSNLEADALLIGRVGALCGNVHIATAPSFVSEHALIARIVANCEIRWLYYLATYLNLGQYAQGTAQPVIAAERIRRLEVPFPPLPIQRAITDYLDRETAEIDAMAAELDELVAEMEERRGSVVRITLADITDKAMAGESPGHKWAKLGNLVQTISGVGFPPKLQGNADQEFPFYKVGSLNMVDSDGAINDERNTVSHATAQKLGARIVPSGSLLMAKVGAALFLSRFVPTRVDSCIDNNMLALVPDPITVNARFLTYALSGVPVNLLANPGPVPSLNVQGLKDERLPLPTLDEQRCIVEHLDEVTTEIDSMIADAQELKALLAERRSALITEIVTGRKEVPVA